MSLSGVEALIKKFDGGAASNAEQRSEVDISADRALATGLVSNASGNNQTVLLAYANQRRKEEMANLKMMLEMADALQLSESEKFSIRQKIQAF